MAADEDAVRVEVAYSPHAGAVDVVELALPCGATLRAAVERSGLIARHAVPEPLHVGVWGRRRSLDDTVNDGDRVEIYRPLLVDPKEARRLRQRRQGALRATCSPKR